MESEVVKGAGLSSLHLSSLEIEKWQSDNPAEGMAASFANLSTELVEINCSEGNGTSGADTPADGAGFTAGLFFMCLMSGLASLLTIGGNVLVILSFIINRALRTVNNYLILSLAAADLVIGVISMNLFTIFLMNGRWTLGPVLCDIWLALDYVASNASVMNLVIICLDRYFSVSKPVEYRNRRTPKRFIMAITGAWSISFILWAPWILFWQYIVNERTVQPGECYIQFIKDNKAVTVITAVAAFYLPAGVMCCLYWKVYVGIKNRRKKLLNMKEIKLPKDQCVASISEEDRLSAHQSSECQDHIGANDLLGGGAKPTFRRRSLSALAQICCDVCGKSRKVNRGRKWVSAGKSVERATQKSRNEKHSAPSPEKVNLTDGPRPQKPILKPPVGGSAASETASKSAAMIGSASNVSPSFTTTKASADTEKSVERMVHQETTMTGVDSDDDLIQDKPLEKELIDDVFPRPDDSPEIPEKSTADSLKKEEAGSTHFNDAQTSDSCPLNKDIICQGSLNNDDSTRSAGVELATDEKGFEASETRVNSNRVRVASREGYLQEEVAIHHTSPYVWGRNRPVDGDDEDASETSVGEAAPKNSHNYTTIGSVKSEASRYFEYSSNDESEEEPLTRSTPDHLDLCDKSLQNTHRRRRLPSLPLETSTIKPILNKLALMRAMSLDNKDKNEIPPTDLVFPKCIQNMPTEDKGSQTIFFKDEAATIAGDPQKVIGVGDSGEKVMTNGAVVNKSKQTGVHSGVQPENSLIMSQCGSSSAGPEQSGSSSQAATPLAPKSPGLADKAGGKWQEQRPGRIGVLKRMVNDLSRRTPTEESTPEINKTAEKLKTQVVKKKLQSLNKETKAARLLASILGAFIILWLPYNIIVLVEAFCMKDTCIPDVAWNIGYWLCYLNSTLNPVCYAMCNKAFRQTFKFLLSMKWIRPENRRFRPQMI